jgi:hypothetical protein
MSVCLSVCMSPLPSPRYASDHQLAVIDCLEDQDETLKRKTVITTHRTTPHSIRHTPHSITSSLHITPHSTPYDMIHYVNPSTPVSRQISRSCCYISPLIWVLTLHDPPSAPHNTHSPILHITHPTLPHPIPHTTQLDLLFRMTNAVNVEFIVEKLLSYLTESSSDDHFRTDLVTQITQVYKVQNSLSVVKTKLSEQRK